MFTVQNNDSVDLTLRIECADTRLRPRHREIHLSLSIAEHEDGVRIDWEYCTDLFERDTILRLAENFEVLLEAIAAARRHRSTRACGRRRAPDAAANLERQRL